VRIILQNHNVMRLKADWLRSMEKISLPFWSRQRNIFMHNSNFLTCSIICLVGMGVIKILILH